METAKSINLLTRSNLCCFSCWEWGVPVHNDKKLFELLSFSTALAELTWPAILNKRHIFREVFVDFDPIAVSKLNEKKIASPGSPASSLLSERKLRSVIENARQICRVPIKTSKADTTSKDLVERGFRGVGPTVVYSFMQAVGITNDHLIICYRYQECIAEGGVRERDKGLKAKIEGKQPEDVAEFELA